MLKFFSTSFDGHVFYYIYSLHDDAVAYCDCGSSAPGPGTVSGISSTIIVITGWGFGDEDSDFKTNRSLEGKKNYEKFLLNKNNESLNILMMKISIC